MKKHKVLITGGGGFVGRQTEQELTKSGHDVTTVDRNPPVHYFRGKYVVADYLEHLINTTDQYDTIIHLAAEHLVEQSVTQPAKYYENNVMRMKTMLDVMLGRNIKNIVFSSSGNTYGRQGGNGPLKEDLYYDPENPYASTKVAGELLIKDYARAYGLKHVTFRYFNAAGADPEGLLGYTQRPATHVIPILCNKILNGESFTIFGHDYPTKDGTCVRDYVHVADIARAHEKALGLFDNQLANQTFNLGGGSEGVSVQQLVHFAGEVVGRIPHIIYADRRAGDPAMLVADITKAKNILEWNPQYNIMDIIEHAWEWETNMGKYYETSK